MPMGAQGAVSGKCPLPHRHRKPWALLTDEQKDMFIDGFQQVRKNGKLDVYRKIFIEIIINLNNKSHIET